MSESDAASNVYREYRDARDAASRPQQVLMTSWALGLAHSYKAMKALRVAWPALDGQMTTDTAERVASALVDAESAFTELRRAAEDIGESSAFDEALLALTPAELDQVIQTWLDTHTGQ